MSPQAGADLARRVAAWIVRLQESFACLVLAAMAALTFIDVAGRYLFTRPVFGASEMISTMLALLVFAGLGSANASDKHIVVELLDHKVRRLCPRAYDLAIAGLSIVAMGLITYVLFAQAVEAFHVESATFVLEWPLGAILAAVAVLALLSLAAQVLALAGRFRGKARSGLQDGNP